MISFPIIMFFGPFMEKINWKKLPKSQDPKLVTAPYQKLETLCLQKTSKKSLQELLHEGHAFAKASGIIEKTVEKFQSDMHSILVLSLILLWSQYTLKESSLGERHLNLMAELVQDEILPSKKNMTLQDYAKQGHEPTIDRIRSHSTWLIQKKEDMVSFYLDFANWVNLSTYGYISLAIDPDKTITARRKFPFEAYIKLQTLLPLRERILIKLFYLGGERALEEIIALKIQDIDFKNNQIHFESHFVRYPLHVIDDIIQHIGDRKKGYVFISKQGQKINHSVPYRALKAAAAQLGLASTFTFKDLIKEY
jgi:integrase